VADYTAFSCAIMTVCMIDSIMIDATIVPRGKKKSKKKADQIEAALSVA